MSSINPWERRPKAPCGDASPYPIYCAVGLALSLWETTESEISIAYVGLLQTTDFREDSYFSKPGFKARHDLVQKAIEDNVNQKDCSGFPFFMNTMLNYGFRRNEIAHGRVYPIGSNGFYLAPSNTLTWNFPNDTAAYHYTSVDIHHFCQEFFGLSKAAMNFARRLAGRR